LAIVFVLVVVFCTTLILRYEVQPIL
jgi:hypothetical protein